MKKLAAIAVASILLVTASAGAETVERKPVLGVHVSRVAPDSTPPHLTPSIESINDLSHTLVIAPTGGAGLVINATFDSSITGNGSAAAIESAINAAISVLQSLYSDPITVYIYFRYASTDPKTGNPLSGGTLAQSYWFGYTGYTWSAWTGDLIADAKTSNDTTANGSLPMSSLSTDVLVTSANGRALGESSMVPAMNSATQLGSGAGFIYDGVVTLNSSQPFQFTRPTLSGNYDAQRATEHEMDEVLGLGALNGSGSYRPQDVFSFSAPGTRSISTSGTRYFSINGGTTNIVNFNQNSGGDYGDWYSPACPQGSLAYVQNAFGCSGEYKDVTATSPEGINLDIIGYDLVSCTAPTAPTIVSATPAATSVSLTWTASTGSATISYQVQRSALLSGGFANVGSTTTGTSFTDTTALGGTAYLYRVVASNACGSATSTNVLATTVIYTNTITAGTSIIQAVDINEMRNAVDAVRTLDGIGPGAYTYGSGTPQRIAAGTVVHAADINELRTNLNTAWNGLFGATPTYTNTITAGVSVIQALDFNEIRNLMK